MTRKIINLFLTIFFSGIIALLIYQKILYPTIIPVVFDGTLYIFGDWTHTIFANTCVKEGIDVYIENPCDPWGRKHTYGQILLHLPFVEKFKKIYLFYIPILINFIFILLIVIFFNTYKTKKNYFVLFFIFSIPFLLAIERANIDILIFLILFILCRYKNLILNYFLILLSFAMKFYPIFFGIVLFFKKSFKQILVNVTILFLLVVIFTLFQSETFIKVFNNQSSFSGEGAYQFSFKGLIATIKDFNIFYGGKEQILIKYFLIFVLFGLPVFFYTKYFIKIMQNNFFVGEIFETNNFENRFYIASSITLIICYILVQNWLYREIFFLGLIPWILSNDHKKNSFLDILFYSILIKFILTTIFVILVQNYYIVFLKFNFFITFFKHLIDFYLMWIISLILLFNLTQYFKKLKSRAF
tara:strand:- start:122 stop:1363 length:1242 start_codon:yes stop_codon:yes gene_type:complete